jgi:hypothetical protein
MRVGCGGVDTGGRVGVAGNTGVAVGGSGGIVEKRGAVTPGSDGTVETGCCATTRSGPRCTDAADESSAARTEPPKNPLMTSRQLAANRIRTTSSLIVEA